MIDPVRAGAMPGVGVPAHLAAGMTVAEQHDWIREFLRARPVSRRAALRGAAGVLGGLGLGVLLGGCGTSEPAPFTGRRLSFGRDPGRQMAMATELSAGPRGTVLVDLGTDQAYGTTLSAEVRHLVSVVPQQNGTVRAAEQWFAHGLAGGLDPGRIYHYRFRLPDGTTGPDAVFTTAPGGRRPFTFTAFGDHGVDPTRTIPAPFANSYRPDDTRRTAHPAASLVDLIAAHRPAFHLLAGDICYADPSGMGHPVRNNAPQPADSGFDNFDPLTWTRYFATIERSAATTPWMFTTGNHDMEALYADTGAPGATHGYGGHAVRLDLPAGGPTGCPSVYAFRYSTLGVLSIDANDLSTEITTNAGYSNGTQLAWVRDTLAAMRADPAVDFVVAFFHHCAYSTVNAHASDDGVRTTLAPLFDQYSVDLAVQGHNHAFERTNPIRDGRGTVAAPDGATVHPATDGTTYICIGSAGRARYGWQPGETDRYLGRIGTDSGTLVTSVLNVAGGGKVQETVDWSVARYLDYAVLVIDVHPGTPGFWSTMTIRAITDRGHLIDTVTLARVAATPMPACPASSITSTAHGAAGSTVDRARPGEN